MKLLNIYLLSIVCVSVKPGGGCVAYKSQCCPAVTIAGSIDDQSQAAK